MRRAPDSGLSERILFVAPRILNDPERWRILQLEVDPAVADSAESGRALQRSHAHVVAQPPGGLQDRPVDRPRPLPAAGRTSVAPRPRIRASILAWPTAPGAPQRRLESRRCGPMFGIKPEDSKMRRPLKTVMILSVLTTTLTLTHASVELHGFQFPEKRASI